MTKPCLAHRASPGSRAGCVGDRARSRRRPCGATALRLALVELDDATRGRRTATLFRGDAHHEACCLARNVDVRSSIPSAMPRSVDSPSIISAEGSDEAGGETSPPTGISSAPCTRSPRLDASRVVFSPALPPTPRLSRPHSVTKGAGDDGTDLRQRDARPIGTDPARADANGMRAAVAPGEDPMTLPTAEAVAETIVPMCLPSFAETGKIYDYRAGRLNSFRPPA